MTSSDRFCGRAVLGQSRSAVLVLPIAPGTLWRDPKPSQQTTSLPGRRLLGARGFQALSSGHFVLHLLHLSSTTPSSWKSSLTSPGRIRNLLQAEVNPASLSLGPGEGRLGGGTPPRLDDEGGAMSSAGFGLRAACSGRPTERARREEGGKRAGPRPLPRKPGVFLAVDLGLGRGGGGWVGGKVPDSLRAWDSGPQNSWGCGRRLGGPDCM